MDALVSGTAEDVMRTDAPPDDVRLIILEGHAELERRPTVGCPSQLEHAIRSADPLDAEAPAEPSRGTGQVLDELLYRAMKPCAVSRVEQLQILAKAIGQVVGRQGHSGSSSSALMRSRNDSESLNVSTRPYTMSSPASRSPRCQDSVQNQA